MLTFNKLHTIAFISSIIWASNAFSQTSSEGGKLINNAWLLFTGKNGNINEGEAIRMMQSGIAMATNEGNENARSIGKNNLGAIYSCAYDVKFRDVKLGGKLISDEFGKNKFSDDNYLWDVFKNNIKVNQEQFFVSFRDRYSDHIIWKYIESNKNRLPNNRNEAIKILEVAANNGDWVAAQRLGFIYECDLDKLDLIRASKWMKLSLQNASQYGANEREKNSIQNRLNRYSILEETDRRNKKPANKYLR
jgi:hypothetical protein